MSAIGPNNRSINALTAFEKYQALEISGTSGKTKKPAIAIGSDITPSMMKSLQHVSINFSHCGRRLTIANLSTLPSHQGGRQPPSNILRT
jgi:hypothetical protein